MRLAIDSCVLGIACHEQHKEHQALMAWLTAHMADPGSEVFLPSVSDYELRRELRLHVLRGKAGHAKGLGRLDSIGAATKFVTLTDAVLKRAADLWAQARKAGKPTADPKALDADCMIAAQALNVGAAVVTDNAKHLSRYCMVINWRTTPPPTSATP